MSFEVREGECVVLLGANGAGKSTLLEAIVGGKKAASGSISIKGESLLGAPAKRIARLVSYVPQEEVSPYAFTVSEIVSMGRLAQSGSLFDSGEDRSAVRKALERTDCAELGDRSILNLSGGEKQRVYVARALAQDAPLMVLDEPTSHMDVGHTLDMAELVESLKRDSQTLLIAVHDLNFALRIADRILLLHRGNLVFQGKADELLATSHLEEAYGTRFERLVRGDGSVIVAPIGKA
jgi:iron complex transport system ATP-binding protein